MIVNSGLSIVGLLLLIALGLGGLLLIGLLIGLIVKALSKGGGAGRAVAAVIVTVVVFVALLVGLVGLYWGSFREVRQTAYLGQPNHAMSDQTWDSMYGRWDESRPTQGWDEGHYTETRRSDGQQTDPRMERVQTPPEPVHADGTGTLDISDNTIVVTSPTSPTPGVTVAGSPWSNAVEQFQDFQADVYPSFESAAEALGRRVGSRLMETPDTNEGKKRSIYVWRDGTDGNIRLQNGGLVISRTVLEAVATGIRQKLDEPAYVSVERPPTPGSIAVRMAIQEVTFEQNSRWRKQAETRSGSIALRVETPDGPFSVSTRFNDAPWVVDRSAFAKNFADGGWVVAYSKGDHTTHQEARQDALTAATNALLPLAKARISQLSESDQRRYAQQMAKDPDWLRSRVADELVSQNLVTDRFTQSFARPYGATVWREAILVDASPKRIESLARSLVQGVNARVVHQRTIWFSYIALAGLIFGTYLFLNMATKGYYAWALRFAVVGGIAAAVFLVRFL